MTDAQALVLSQELADLANLVAQILNDLTLPLTSQQTQSLQNYCIQLTNQSRQIAAGAALAALNAAQSDFNTMTQATTAANAAVTQAKSNAAKLNAILSVLGAAINFGTALLSGSIGGALAAAGSLASAAASV